MSGKQLHADTPEEVIKRDIADLMYEINDLDFLLSNEFYQKKREAADRLKKLVYDGKLQSLAIASCGSCTWTDVLLALEKVENYSRVGFFNKLKIFFLRLARKFGVPLR